MAVDSLELHAPAGQRATAIDPSGETVLPNGRLITPRGIQVKVAPHPYGLALSPDGRTLVTANSGTAPFSVSIMTNLESSQPKVVQIPSGVKPAEGELESVFMGVAIAPDNRTLYVAEGDNGNVGIFDLVTHQRLGSVSLDGEFQGKTYAHSLTGELKLAPDGRTLYVLDLAHFRLVLVDTQSKQVVASFSVGRLPFALALGPDGARAYVSNIGMFEYSLVPGVTVARGPGMGPGPYHEAPKNKEGLDFPAFGFPSKEAEQGTVVDGKRIPGLGDPNIPESNSVWTIDVSNPRLPRVTAKVRTGLPVGEQSVGGSSPGGVVAGRKRIFVSNTSQDSVSIIDASSNQVKQTIVLEPARTVAGLRGVLPFGLALSPDEKRLYVACAGINAIAVLDTKEGKVLGYIPTGWFPARVEVSRDGETLYVANAKGFGAGPNGGPNFRRGPEGPYIGDITKGMVSIIKLGQESIPSTDTNQVLSNNGFVATPAASARSADFPIPPAGRPSSKIHHVVYVVKENRTFDQVFGDLKEVGGAKAEADPQLVEYGEDATVENKDTGQSVEHARVTPNHHALAERFGISDNYYVDSDVSVDGHHWLQGNYPNELLETAWPASYGDKFTFVADPDAPGRLQIGGAAPRPETYPQAGSLWTHLARHHITFRNYGEGLDVPGNEDGPALEPTGLREILNAPLPEALFEDTSRSYPTFNTDISDQYRFQQFLAEFRVRYLSGKEPLPQFICIWLPNDHTDKPRPTEGYPFRASYVADNDLALGKLVELFSHSLYWKDMAIFVTEDDAQAGTDHVDAHRSPLLVIGPYSRRTVWHAHTSMESILKTFDLILGLPALNQYDATATDLSECFTDQPDFTPYNALPSDTRIFDPAKVVESGLDIKAGRVRSEPLDDPAIIRRELRERDRDRE
ncbi:MAG TPA: bifunctional YncE family protein/alkaline phosphatase family protein [Terriglobia bacterium]|nr:bifunctional YncE family protein/alkaline phosphatase family protein [Terriglobia bacterium]